MVYVLIPASIRIPGIAIDIWVFLLAYFWEKFLIQMNLFPSKIIFIKKVINKKIFKFS
jgi:hypothetical protein